MVAGDQPYPPSVFDHPILAGTDRRTLGSVLTPVRTVRIESGEVLTMPAGPPRLHLVLDGLLRCYRLSGNGQQLLLELIPPGGFDGVIRLAGGTGHYTVAVQPSFVASIPKRLVDRAIASDSRFAANLVWASARRLATRERQMEALVTRRSVTAVANLLVLLCERSTERDRHHVILPPRLTHQAMSEMLGMRRETVTTAMLELKAQRVVSKSAGRYAVDLAALLELAGSA
jgi:CRP-like cAMP-binding protein